MRRLWREIWNVTSQLRLLRGAFPLLLQLLQLWSAGRRHCLLWFLQPAVRRDVTLHSRPLSGSVWANVCERVGRCWPMSWKSPKISQQPSCHLHNWGFLLTDSFLQLHLTYSKQVCFCGLHEHQQQGTSWVQLKRQQESRQLLCGFETLVHKGKGSAATRRLCDSALLKSTTSFVNTAEKGGIHNAGLPMQIKNSHDRTALNANTSVITFTACKKPWVAMKLQHAEWASS